MDISSFDDCYFYYYSSCTKGSDCPFRHCEAALGTETVCTSWREGMCFRSNCKFRHMESRINRSTISCYWENQPGGCRKPHCVFYHHRNRARMNVFAETKGLILPVASLPASPVKAVDSSAEWESKENLSLSPSAHPIQPVVVSLGEGEESDTESTASTPMKVVPSVEKRIYSPSKAFIDSAPNGSSSEVDLGIKTLEQIKMAKIHRESEHFYSPDKTEVADADSSAECVKLETMHNDPNSYYSQADFCSPTVEVSPEKDLETEPSENAVLYTKRDLRDVLKKRRYIPEERIVKEPSTKRIISLKRSAGAVEDECPALTVTVGKENEEKGKIGFRVKTLEEIRKEKEMKQSNMNSAAQCSVDVPIPEEEVVNKSSVNFLCEIKEHSFENGVKSKGLKRKLRRKPLDLYRDLLRQTNVEAKKESSGQDLSQISEDNASADETSAMCMEAAVTKEIEIKPNNSLKRASADMPFASKVRKTTLVYRVPDQKLSSELDRETSLKPVEAHQKVDNSLTFKRRNIIRRKNVGEFHHSQAVVSEDSNSQFQDSDLSKELPLQATDLSVSSNQNGICLNSDDSCVEMKDVEMSNEEEKTSSLTSPPSVPVQCEKKLSTLSTVDEIDTLFLGSEADICLDEMDTSAADTKAEDLFLEFEQMLQS